MNIYIWERIDELTDNYHAAGGLVIIAESEERCKELEPKIKDQKPDRAFVTNAIIEEVFVFPNAGCC